MKDYYSVKRVSNSSLSWFLKSPKYFKMMLDKDIEEESKSYYETGQEIHMFLLEPEEFEKKYLFYDYDIPKSPQQKQFCDTFASLKKGTKNEKLLKAYRTAYVSKESDEIILEKAKTLEKNYQEYIKYYKIRFKYEKVLSSATHALYNDIKFDLLSHKKARKLMFNEDQTLFGNTDKLFIKNELPIFWVHPTTGIKCKSMLDRLVIDYENKVVTMIDLKTSSQIADFKDKAIEYRYHRQLAFYWMALYWYFKNELNLNIDDFDKETYIVTVSTKGLPETRVYKVSDLKLTEGLQEIDVLMKELKWHFDNNEWDRPRSYYEGEGIEIL